jgi:heterotetrameric sarcosine oxidase gamma subunit
VADPTPAPGAGLPEVPGNGAPPAPLARSPIAPAPPVAVVAGWEASGRRSGAALRLTDCTPLAKVLVRATPGGPVARHLGVGHGRAARDEHGTLVVGSGPDEWLLLAGPGTEAALAAPVREVDDPDLVSVVELFTHGRALVRLTGADAPRLLAKVCAVDLADRATPDGTAFRSSVAKVATDVVRDDGRGALRASGEGARSYLLHCERSSGQYLFDAILDAGREFGVEPDGFTGKEI